MTIINERSFSSRMCAPDEQKTPTTTAVNKGVYYCRNVLKKYHFYFLVLWYGRTMCIYGYIYYYNIL